MPSEMDIEKAVAVALWHVLTERGGGDFLQGRASVVGYEPVDSEWLAGIEYAQRADPRGPLAGKSPQALLRHVKNTYREGVVGVCLDAYWYDQGMPTIELGHKLAASLLLTSIPKDVMAGVQMPFKSFHIQLPSGLLDFTDGDVKCIKVGDHVVRDLKPPYEPRIGTAFVVRAENGGSYSLGTTLPHLLTIDFTEHAKAPRMDQELSYDAPRLLESSDVQRLPLVATLIAGVCLYLTGDREQFPVKQTGKGHKAWVGDRREPGSAPLVRTFRLTKEVQHNFTDTVRDYCAGKSNKMTVQCVVTGHWRNQACGPRMQERKRIFIEPFWKGQRDAPIAVRSHRLGEAHDDI